MTTKPNYVYIFVSVIYFITIKIEYTIIYFMKFVYLENQSIPEILMKTFFLIFNVIYSKIFYAL